MTVNSWSGESSRGMGLQGNTETSRILDELLRVNRNFAHQMLVVRLFVAGMLVQNVQILVELAENEAVIELPNHFHFVKTVLHLSNS